MKIKIREDKKSSSKFPAKMNELKQNKTTAMHIVFSQSLNG
ncbi:hypothetical protein [Flavobacterium sp. CYK-55]|nr:hypothetical protein [Flavobacterium sp. CYK-55]